MNALACRPGWGMSLPGSAASGRAAPTPLVQGGGGAMRPAGGRWVATTGHTLGTPRRVVGPVGRNSARVVIVGPMSQPTRASNDPDRPHPTWVTPAELAAQMGRPVRWVQDAMKAGDLPSVRVGRFRWWTPGCLAALERRQLAGDTTVPPTQDWGRP